MKKTPSSPIPRTLKPLIPGGYEAPKPGPSTAKRPNRVPLPDPKPSK